jgi:hypothetical protein
MNRMTRAPVTLVAAGGAGLLVWLSTRINDSTTGGYWAVYGLIAGAGLTMALSQLIGGWTKWGRPRISLSVLLIAFLPALVCVLWVVLAGQPHPTWLQRHVTAWSGDIHVSGVVHHLKEYVAVLAFGLGLVLGFTLETAPSKPAAEPALPERQPEAWTVEQPGARVERGRRERRRIGRVPSR